ncbi:cupin domain-containing protein [Niveibacterium umoris]|uniref:Quercetin dioxygenase-like cupin family protein n=1 Tax=Niveibacterium umoris TaxID=1193620 RepID=A0A840BPN3_9RHOO|nr:cupin domain-containing protein [Niveibacterium umoris]MBB4013488.1 quercetin dioxygenase-like cupin family protein [Niveibacterium umoris]
MKANTDTSAAVNVARAGSHKTFAGPAEWFTGTVNVEMLFTAPGPATVSGGLVTFLPGARTAWHAHPLGQTLVVTSGCGRVQHWGGPIQEIRPGDVVTIPAGVKHWHGAAPDTAMSHIAIQASLDGKNSDWMEKVSAQQYAG